ncbi:hypothetical protein [Corynebacterium occultum]|nr:hypothetical protein [Corynebacterium occultum]
MNLTTVVPRHRPLRQVRKFGGRNPKVREYLRGGQPALQFT